MQWCTNELAVWPAFDRCGGGDASGMSHPEVCVSGGDLLCLSGVLDAEKVKMRKGDIEKTDS